MTPLTHDFATALMGAQPPCLSLYQPTHRHHPDNQQGQIRFRNLVKVLEHSLLQQYPQARLAALGDAFGQTRAKGLGSDDLAEVAAAAAVERALRRFDDQITRVEVHLSDENAGKFGRDDKRCLMEARLEGRQPVAVTHQAGSLSEAVDGAVNKLKSLLDSALGRLSDH